MHQFHSARRIGNRGSRVSVHLRHDKRHYWPQPFAAAQDTVPHGGKDRLRLMVFRGQDTLQFLVDE